MAIVYDEMGNPIYNDGSDDVSSPTEFIDSTWKSAVLRWKNAVDQFAAARAKHDELYQIASELGPDELQAWENESTRAYEIQQAIEMLQDKLASASTWARQTFGLGAIGSMGIIPLIPVAVIVGSIAAVTAITYSLYTYDDQLQRKWDYLHAHPDATPEQVAAVLNSGAYTGPLSGVKSTAMWIAIAGALFVFGPQLMKMIEGRTK